MLRLLLLLLLPATLFGCAQNITMRASPTTEQTHIVKSRYDILIIKGNIEVQIAMPQEYTSADLENFFLTIRNNSEEDVTFIEEDLTIHNLTSGSNIRIVTTQEQIQQARREATMMQFIYALSAIEGAYNAQNSAYRTYSGSFNVTGSDSKIYYGNYNGTYYDSALAQAQTQQAMQVATQEISESSRQSQARTSEIARAGFTERVIKPSNSLTGMISFDINSNVSQPQEIEIIVPINGEDYSFKYFMEEADE